jgi:hypothetical protein
MGKPSVHHDALEFPDGETVLLTQRDCAAVAGFSAPCERTRGAKARFARQVIGLLTIGLIEIKRLIAELEKSIQEQLRRRQ